MTILETIKNQLTITDAAFDTEILSYINAGVASLVQLGCVDFENIEVINTTEWPVTFQDKHLESLTKEYMFIYVRDIFDPTSSATINSVRNTYRNMIEFRLASAYRSYVTQTV